MSASEAEGRHATAYREKLRRPLPMSIADPNKTILTGENPFIRLSPKDGEPNSTEASYWRLIFSPAGPGHGLYLKSELTERRGRIYSDNIARARWRQSTSQGMPIARVADRPC